MSTNYYQLIYKQLKELSQNNQLGDLNVDNILEDPQLNSLIHSVAYIAEKIELQIQNSELNIYKFILKKIYNFLLETKPSNILINFDPQNVKEYIFINKNTELQINTKEKKYLYTILNEHEFLPIQIILSHYIRYEEILKNNYFGNFFLKIQIIKACSIKQMSQKTLKLFIDHENYNEIIQNIMQKNTCVYVYKQGILKKIGYIKIDTYNNFNDDNKNIPKYFDYFYQYLINEKIFAFINIYFDSIEKIAQDYQNNDEITILIPSKKKYIYINIIKYYVISAFNYNKKTTNSFKITDNYKQIISLNYEENYNNEILHVLELTSIHKFTKQLITYLPRYHNYHSKNTYTINNNLTWDYNSFKTKNQNLTEIIIIPNKYTNNLNIIDQIFYATIYYTQIIRYQFIHNNIIIRNTQNIKNLKIITPPTNTILNNETFNNIDDILIISRLNINNHHIFDQQFKQILNILFKFFNQSSDIKKIIYQINLQNTINTKSYIIEIILYENIPIKIGLLISIIHFINNYFDISYNFKYKFINQTNKENLFYANI